MGTRNGIVYSNGFDFSGTKAVGGNTMTTDGQLLIGKTGGLPVIATLTAGTGIGVVNGIGSITVNSVGGGVTWTTVGASTPLIINSGFICTAGAALSFSLPAASAVGDLVAITLDGSTSWVITQAAAQQIRLGALQTTAGAGGTLTSTAQGDTVILVCSVANLKWNCTSLLGNLLIV